MLELSSLRLDPQKSTEGTWIDYISGTRLLIARYDNREMQAFKTRKAVEHGKIFTDYENNREEAERLSAEIEAEALATFVLLDWEGFIEKGQPIEYTTELGIKIFSDETYDEFREFVSRVARNSTNYRVESEASVAEAVKAAAAS